MSENLDLVRSIYADWERGDFSSIDWAHPKIEFVGTDGPSPGSGRGVEGWEGPGASTLNVWEDLGGRSGPLPPLDGERVVVPSPGPDGAGRAGWTWAESGRGAYLFHIHDGKVIKLVLYWTARSPSPTSALRSRRCRSRTWRSPSGPSMRSIVVILTSPTSLTTPDFEWFPAMPGVVEGGGYAGREGIQVLPGGDLTAPGRRATGAVPIEFRDLGEQVLVLGRMEGRGTGSGVPVDAPLGMVFDFRGGKVSRARTYLDQDEALRAAGLTE